MKTSFIFKSFFAAFVLFASAALVSCEKENETPEPEASKPAAVSFKYTNYETEDMLEYCNIVIEYTDVNGTVTADMLTDDGIIIKKGKKVFHRIVTE